MPLPLADEIRRFDATRSLASARTIPNTWYTSPEIAAHERRTVFGTTWQMVGRAEQVAAPGSFLTANIAGEPIIVVRAEDGVLRAFFNVCRHRAAPILNEPCGTATKLRCRYHGWTYDLAGKLRGTPEFDGVEEFRKEDNGLPPIAVATWGPFVWVHLDPPKQNRRRLPVAIARLVNGQNGRTPVRSPRRVRIGVQLEGLRRQLSRRRLSREHGASGAGRRARLHRLQDDAARELQRANEPNEARRSERPGVANAHGHGSGLLVGLPELHAKRLRRRHGHEPGAAARARSLQGDLRLLLRSRACQPTSSIKACKSRIRCRSRTSASARKSSAA